MNKRIASCILCAALSGCAVVTAPVKLAGKAAVTTVKVTGKAATTVVKAAIPDKKEKTEDLNKQDQTSPTPPKS